MALVEQPSLDSQRSGGILSADAVPEFDALELVYGSDGLDDAVERYSKIQAAFKEKFGAVPEVYGRSPGRVNLIGEHIDYEGYGVLPMAIAYDTVVAIRKGGEDLHIANVEGQRFADYHFSTRPDQDVDTANHGWANYVMCAYKGVFEHMAAKGKLLEPVGLQIMVHGRVPTGAGVSSSSALVCSASLALLGAYGISLPKADVAEFACACERYVGTQSGGMDQAISIMGERGLAKLVDFNPIRTTDVNLPKGVTFVIANSLAVSNKAETADGRYNLRVVECRLAAACLCVALGRKPEDVHDIKTLMDAEPIVVASAQGRCRSPRKRKAEHSGLARLQANPFADSSDGMSDAPEDETSARPLKLCAAAVKENLHEHPYTQEEVEKILGVGLAELLNAHQQRVLPVARERGGFSLRARALHVYEEALRVRKFSSLCYSVGLRTGSIGSVGSLSFSSNKSPDSQKQDVQIPGSLMRTKTMKTEYQAIGTLLNASHNSLRDLYDCSCPELDELVQQCRATGAFGSRLTGAGWGGCTVSMVKDEDVPEFVAALQDGYYAAAIKEGRATPDEATAAVFVSKPSPGGAILRSPKELQG